MRRAFEGHRAADMDVGALDLALGKAEMAEHIEAEIVKLRRVELQDVAAERLAEGELVEHELDVEGGGETILDGLDLGRSEALPPQRFMVDRRRAGERAEADRIVDDGLDLLPAIAERPQRVRDRLVDDLEIAAAGQLLELHQREIGLDAGGVAIHDQADRAGGRDHRRLGIAIAVALAELHRQVPGRHGAVDQQGVAAMRMIERHRQRAQPLIALRLAMGGAPMVAHDPQHVGAVLGKAREGAELARHLGRGGIGDAGHDRREGAAQRAALWQS